MIILLTGQHNSGKSTLARRLVLALTQNYNRETLWLDGDMWRNMTSNHDYRKAGRVRNLQLAMQVAASVDSDSRVIVMSFIAPYEELRNSWKQEHSAFIVHVWNGSRNTETPGKLCNDYQWPSNPDYIVHSDAFDSVYEHCVDCLTAIILGLTKRANSADLSGEGGEGI